MSKIGRLITARLFSRILLVVCIFFGILLLVEFLDTGRFRQTAEISGPIAPILLSVISALRWSMLTLPVTVLIGSILAMIELHRQREMVIIASAGHSIWAILKWPALAIVLAGGFMSVVVDGYAIKAYQALDSAQIGWGRAYGVQNREAWFKQTGSEGNFFIYAKSVSNGGTDLQNVTVLRNTEQAGSDMRLHAKSAKLDDGFWVLKDGISLNINRKPLSFDTYQLPTTATASEMNLKLGTTEDMSWMDLVIARQAGISDPLAKAAADTRYHKLNAIPFVLLGSLLIAVAFTAGYRRAGHYGWTIAYGIVIGLVVFIIMEMADRAGSAGVLNPIIAAWGPAMAAIVIGLSVILRKEDGRV